MDYQPISSDTGPEDRELEIQDQKQKLEKYFLSLLNRRDYSSHALRTKAIDRKYPEPMIDEVIEDYQTRNYVNDIRYTEDRIRGLIRKGKSPKFIFLKCQQEHLPVTEFLIEDVMADLKITAEFLREEYIQKLIRTGKIEDREDPKLAASLFRAMF